jgi:hypothetical protein
MYFPWNWEFGLALSKFPRELETFHGLRMNIQIIWNHSIVSSARRYEDLWYLHYTAKQSKNRRAKRLTNQPNNHQINQSFNRTINQPKSSLGPENLAFVEH